jgi:hypothetical protein
MQASYNEESLINNYGFSNKYNNVHMDTDVQRTGSHCAHCHRAVLIQSVSNAQLTMLVASPATQATVRQHSACVFITRDHVGNVCRTQKRCTNTQG